MVGTPPPMEIGTIVRSGLNASLRPAPDKPGVNRRACLPVGKAKTRQVLANAGTIFGMHTVADPGLLFRVIKNKYVERGKGLAYRQASLLVFGKLLDFLCGVIAKFFGGVEVVLPFGQHLEVTNG